MKQTHTVRHLILVLVTTGGLVTMLLIGQEITKAWRMPFLSERSSSTAQESTALSLPELRSAEQMFLPEAVRMRSRLARSGKNPLPHVSHLAQALHERKNLLDNSVAVTFTGEHIEPGEPWTVSLHDHPQWLTLEFSASSAAYNLDTEAIRSMLKEEGEKRFPPPVDSMITGSEERWKILYATTTEIAKDGYIVDIESATNLLVSSLQNGGGEMVIPINSEHGRILYASPIGAQTLSLLSSGRSNFKGSPANRKYNIAKAVEEHLNGILIPAGTTFSFNATLGGPVTESNGWKEALGIFNGGELLPTPGGGICQTSTTLYRAVVNGGFPIVERRNHSIYVKYYEKYGVGIDAAIFPGVKDLTFENDTSDYLLIQTYLEGQDMIANIYGVPTGRNVTLEGPYFKKNAPIGLLVKDRSMKDNEIAWIQHITLPSGRVEENLLVSQYRTGVPASVVVKYIAEQKETMHTSANPFAASLFSYPMYHFKEVIEDLHGEDLEML